MWPSRSLKNTEKSLSCFTWRLPGEQTQASCYKIRDTANLPTIRLTGEAIFYHPSPQRAHRHTRVQQGSAKPSPPRRALWQLTESQAKVLYVQMIRRRPIFIKTLIFSKKLNKCVGIADAPSALPMSPAIPCHFYADHFLCAFTPNIRYLHHFVGGQSLSCYSLLCLRA